MNVVQCIKNNKGLTWLKIEEDKYMSGEVYQFIGKKFTKNLIKIIKTFPMIGEKFSDDQIFVGLKIFTATKIFVLSILFIEFFYPCQKFKSSDKIYTQNLTITR